MIHLSTAAPEVLEWRWEIKCNQAYNSGQGHIEYSSHHYDDEFYEIERRQWCLQEILIDGREATSPHFTITRGDHTIRLVTRPFGSWPYFENPAAVVFRIQRVFPSESTPSPTATPTKPESPAPKETPAPSSFDPIGPLLLSTAVGLLGVSCGGLAHEYIQGRIVARAIRERSSHTTTGAWSPGVLFAQGQEGGKAGVGGDFLDP